MERRPSQLDAGLTEPQVRTLADWLTLGVFTQAAHSTLDDSSFIMPDKPEPLLEETAQRNLRVVFVTLADSDGHYATAAAQGFSLAEAGERALRNCLPAFARRTHHSGGKPLQQLIKRIKVDVMAQLVPIDAGRVRNNQPIVSDRSLVGVVVGDYDNAWLPEESLRHDLVRTNGKLNAAQVQRHLAHRIRHIDALKPLGGEVHDGKVLDGKVQESQFREGKVQPTTARHAQAQPNTAVPVQIFSTISRLVLLKLEEGGQLTIENGPLLRNHRHDPQLTAEIALRAATEGAAYIARHTDADGKMNYMYDAANDRELNGYNILRHAGSLWSMLQVYHDRPTTNLYRASHAALGFLKRCIVPFSKAYPDAYVVSHDNAAKLGGNGLGLVALAAAYRELGARDVLPLMQGLARWIVGTQASDGEFIYHKVRMDTLTKEPFKSDYYPGEAILGLMQLYKIDRNYRWLEAADKAARWLINVRDNHKKIAQLNRDHWLLYGLNDLYRELPRPEFLAHTRRIIACIQQAQLRNQMVPDWNGGFQNPLNVTATACMCEGMLAGYNLLHDFGERGPVLDGGDGSEIGRGDVIGGKVLIVDEGERRLNEFESLEDSIEAGLKLQLQFRFDEYNSTYLRNPQRAKGAFQSGCRHWSIRVDFTQHSLTSFLMYWRSANI